ncbi:26S proteasome non-ATPase regulatory subunit 4 -like protein [Gossypium arboreum]|uniref:26S proteasome non-ATPase regulatory subunit 4-like protein n=1 Tax=Gossypium arboreum TaxID=29729 RepID=A0A0B0MKR1_GOSAR|nr:26S proteasome non-ATPase regulatory subunit 4 -like protein [Gossypium arboreum]
MEEERARQEAAAKKAAEESSNPEKEEEVQPQSDSQHATEQTLDSKSPTCGETNDSSKDQSSESDVSKVLGDQSFMSSILSSLPGVDPNDPNVKDLLASLPGQSESQEKKNEDEQPKDDK